MQIVAPDNTEYDSLDVPVTLLVPIAVGSVAYTANCYLYRSRFPCRASQSSSARVNATKTLTVGISRHVNAGGAVGECLHCDQTLMEYVVFSLVLRFCSEQPFVTVSKVRFEVLEDSLYIQFS